MSRRAVKLRIRGRVQGVGFRYWTQGEAQALGVDGWVRNEPDGSVSALIAGPEEEVEKMLKRLRVGPPGAEVTGIAHDPADEPAPGGFRILR
jgi:acylphosphatase